MREEDLGNERARLVGAILCRRVRRSKVKEWHMRIHMAMNPFRAHFRPE